MPDHHRRRQVVVHYHLAVQRVFQELYRRALLQILVVDSVRVVRQRSVVNRADHLLPIQLRVKVSVPVNTIPPALRHFSTHVALASMERRTRQPIRIRILV